MTILLRETWKQIAKTPKDAAPNDRYRCPCGQEGVVETKTHLICPGCTRAWDTPLQMPLGS